jgi:hypothetical protein
MDSVSPFVILAVLAVAVIVSAIVFSNLKVSGKLNRLPTFDGYRQANPGLVGDGKVQCSSCGGAQIFVRREGSLLSGVVNLHVCRVCGTNLYRSKT